MKKLLLILLLTPLFSKAQEHVDVLKFGYSNTFDAKFEGTNESTNVKGFEAGLTFPVVINDKYVLITGADFSTHTLQLDPDFNHTTLNSTLLKIGLATTHSEKWSSTIVFLPKMASDYKNISPDDFYYGGYGVAKLKKSENLLYRFGIYGSTEAFGLFATPMLGVYYKSPNDLFEIDASLPIVADINYNLGVVTIGFDYFGIGRSFNISQDEFSHLYVEQSPLEFASYVQFGMLENSVLLRAKVGYTNNTHEVYEQGDKLDFRLAGFSFGDDRTQLNPDIYGGVFVKFEAIYRIHFKKTEKESAK